MIGPESRTPRYSNDEKNLIAEQPGRSVLFLGVLLAITLGLIVRGLISPNKVKSQVAAAASSIHKDLKVEFSSASVSLSRGLLPRFAVLITNVKMESSDPCWMSPILTADEIRLPLSFWALVRGENPVTQVGAGKVDVQLRSEFQDCQKRQDSNQNSSPSIVNGTASGGSALQATEKEVERPRQFVTLKNKKPLTEKTAPQPQVQAILIDELSVRAPTLSAPVELSTFALRLKSNSPRVIEMTAKTHLIKDDQFGDYLSHASVWAEYTEFPNTQLQGRINGNWREGSYELNANYFVQDEELSSQLDLKHVPLSQVAQILKKFGWLKSDVSARQVWVSVNAQMTGKPSDLKTAKVQLKNVHLEGDLGDIRIPTASITSLEPLGLSPFNVNMERVNIEKFLSLSNRPHPSSVFGRLGSFTGRAEVMGPQQISLSGIHSGLEFIFSNKGQRELQTLKEIRTEMKLLNEKWTVFASEARVDNGTLNGTVTVTADRLWKNFEVDGKVDELRFSPNVVRLMTAGGSVGPLNANVKAKIREGQLSSLKGTIATENISAEGVSVGKSRWLLDMVGDEIVADGQIQQASILAGSASFQVLKPVIETEWMNDGQLEIKALSTQLLFKDLKHFAWKNMSVQLLKNVRLTSDGQWDERGDLAGQIQWSNGKTNRRWAVGGQRDQPIFNLADASKKKKQ